MWKRKTLMVGAAAALMGLVSGWVFTPSPSTRPAGQHRAAKPNVLGSATKWQAPTPLPTSTPPPLTAPTPPPPPPASAAPASAPVAAKPAPRRVVAAAPTTPVAGAGEIASDAVCPGQLDPAQTASVLICLTAQARRFHGLSSVTGGSALMAAAAAKLGDMVSCGYGHTACGRAFDYWIGAKGYAGGCNAENIAQGQTTPRQVFEGWMQSPGHRANILGATYRQLGVAEGAGSGGVLWVMELGGC